MKYCTLNSLVRPWLYCMCVHTGRTDFVMYNTTYVCILSTVFNSVLMIEIHGMDTHTVCICYTVWMKHIICIHEYTIHLGGNMQYDAWYVRTYSMYLNRDCISWLYVFLSCCSLLGCSTSGHQHDDLQHRDSL